MMVVIKNSILIDYNGERYQIHPAWEDSLATDERETYFTCDSLFENEQDQQQLATNTFNCLLIMPKVRIREKEQSLKLWFPIFMESIRRSQIFLRGSNAIMGRLRISIKEAIDQHDSANEEINNLKTEISSLKSQLEDETRIVSESRTLKQETGKNMFCTRS